MSARRGITYLFGGNVGTFTITFAASIVVARLLGPSEMGVYAASLSVVYIINGLLNVGLPSYLVREKDLTREKLGTVFTLTLAQSALFATALLLGAPLVGWGAHDPRVTQSIRILALFAAITPIITSVHGLMQRKMQFNRVVIATVANVGVSAIVTIALAANGYSWRSMPFGSGAGAFAALVLTLAMQRRDLIGVPLSRAYIRPILSYGGRIASASMMLNLTSRVPDFMLTRAAGAASTGLYNRGANLVDTFNNTIMTSVGRVMASQMAIARDTPAGIGPVYAKVSRFVTGMFWPAFALLAILSKPVIAMLFGERWLPAAPVLAVIAGAGAINLMVANRIATLVTVGREKDLPRLEAIRGVIGVLLFTAAAYWGGLIWAAATRIADAVIAVVLYSPGIHAATRLSWAEMGRAFARSALVAGITAVPALAVSITLGWPDRLQWSALVGVIALSGAAWVMALFLTKHDLRDELVRAVAGARLLGGTVAGRAGAGRFATRWPFARRGGEVG